MTSQRLDDSSSIPSSPSFLCLRQHFAISEHITRPMKMRHLSIISAFTAFVALSTCNPIALENLFAELEELPPIPFTCASRYSEFPDFELVDTFNSGPLMSDSCGYIALDHSTRHNGKWRVLIEFRGTYSIANTIVDLSTVPQEYVPYSDNPENETDPTQPPSLPKDHHRRRFLDLIPHPSWLGSKPSPSVLEEGPRPTCSNCTVRRGFWTSWQNTRPFILPHIKLLREKYPDYQLHLMGHSLGGAVAALASLEFEGTGYHPTVTTSGEPRTFVLPSEHLDKKEAGLHAGRYRRITHVDNPVPLLPLQEWGYRTRAGEIYISKPSLQPGVSDLRLCFGDEDSWFGLNFGTTEELDVRVWEEEGENEKVGLRKRWGIPIPARYKTWQLFFAHRDYFWRLELCVPGGDPLDFGGGDIMLWEWGW
ncbi:Alpha/Beta hydrolase protein [Hyaloscypha finlandica]|nr:Alpha/Beta hydrolase protein [Hyaloscypha finlandica]